MAVQGRNPKHNREVAKKIHSHPILDGKSKIFSFLASVILKKLVYNGICLICLQQNNKKLSTTHQNLLKPHRSHQPRILLQICET